MVGWGFGVGVLDWVFGVGLFSWWGLGPVVWGLLGFSGWGSLYKHEGITLGKNDATVSLTQEEMRSHQQKVPRNSPKRITL